MPNGDRYADLRRIWLPWQPDLSGWSFCHRTPLSNGRREFIKRPTGPEERTMKNATNLGVYLLCSTFGLAAVALGQQSQSNPWPPQQNSNDWQPSSPQSSSPQ